MDFWRIFFKEKKGYYTPPTQLLVEKQFLLTEK